MHCPHETNSYPDSEDTGVPARATGSGAKLSAAACANALPASTERVHSHHFDLCDAQPSESALAGSLHSSLFLWPVILKAGFSEKCQDRELAISAESTRLLAQNVKDLGKAQSNICLLRDLFDYSFVACNGPTTYQKMLEQMAGRFRFVSAPDQAGESIDVERFENGIYEEAPTLHFLMGSLTRKGQWPELTRIGDTSGVDSSTPRTETDAREEMASVLNRDLGLTKEEQDCVLHVGDADFAASAIEAGIKGWLTVLHDSFPFDRWEVLPQPDDRVDLCIALKDTRRPYMYVPLRTYQLGVEGVQRVLLHMEDMAEMAIGGMQNGSIQ